MLRKYDDWYYLYHEVSQPKLVLSDRSIACWTRDGRTFSRGELLKLLHSTAAKWNKWRRSLPDIEWYKIKGDLFWIPGFVLKPARL
jgi:hypothetical protein